MTSGVEYERLVQEDWNKLSPHTFSRRNFRTAKLIASRGWKYSRVADLIDQPIPGLAEIPIEADLLQTSQYDAAAAAAISHFDARPGIEAANATKLLYQKRRAYIPILDSYARRALCLPWVRVGGYAAVLDKFRESLSVPGNRTALSDI